MLVIILSPRFENLSPLPHSDISKKKKCFKWKYCSYNFYRAEDMFLFSCGGVGSFLFSISLFKPAAAYYFFNVNPVNNYLNGDLVKLKAQCTGWYAASTGYHRSREHPMHIFPGVKIQPTCIWDRDRSCLHCIFRERQRRDEDILELKEVYKGTRDVRSVCRA